ncbi:DoxX family protein [Pigmentibacter sp. JX0631]|uniref:DoxX family protein n=1 Tax=Pigmentibacter sp. JX0631 TaxID=2976982 RepID=UPI0024684DE7|nr:DoxX family protein [Pigmentibacter sp. JX0631]WGL60560.1 DoxX family protein [Pigmentibacter sp. JX0631]
MANSKTLRIVYWVATLPFVAVMLFSAYMYFTFSPQALDGIRSLGYPVYLLKILGTAKLLGSLAILFGFFKTLKEWAYAGFVINLLGAAASHYFVHDPIMKVCAPLFVLIFVLISYMLWKKK